MKFCFTGFPNGQSFKTMQMQTLFIEANDLRTIQINFAPFKLLAIETYRLFNLCIRFIDSTLMKLSWALATVRSTEYHIAPPRVQTFWFLGPPPEPQTATLYITVAHKKFTHLHVILLRQIYTYSLIGHRPTIFFYVNVII